MRQVKPMSAGTAGAAPTLKIALAGRAGLRDGGRAGVPIGAHAAHNSTTSADTTWQ